jgi:hypothetical protein
MVRPMSRAVLYYLHDFPDLPKLVGHASGHRGGDAKRFVDANENC